MSITVSTYNTNSANAGSVVITKPTGVVEGDFMIATINAQSDSNPPVVTPPAGWSTVVISNGTADSLTTFSKIAGSSEEANYTFSMTFDTNKYMIGSITRITGSKYVDISSGKSNSASTTATGTALSPVNTDGVMLFFVGSGAVTTTSSYAIATNNPNWTEQFNVIISPHLSLAMAYSSRPEITSTGAVTATIDSSAINEVNLIVLKTFPENTINETLSVTETKLVNTEYKQLETITTLDSLLGILNRLWNKISKPSTTWTKKNKN